MSSEIVVHPLPVTQRPALRDHLASLAPEDRRLRFGTSLSDAAIDRYVNAIDFSRDDVFAALGPAMDVLGVVHIAYGERIAELGLSVAEAHRRQGIGGTLFARAALRVRNRFVGAVYMHCLAENVTMMRLARKNGMRVITNAGEADAYLALAPANPASIATEWWHQHLALFDYALKVNEHTRDKVFATLARTLADERTA